MSAQWNGSSGTPIKLRTNAHRQAEERSSSRLSQTRQQPDAGDENADAWVEERPRSSIYRYDIPAARQTRKFQARPTRVIKYRRFDRATLVIWLCLAMIIMLAGWWLLTWVANVWQGVQDNLKYGSPRTFQADQYVGLGDSPGHPDHFMALNLHGVIEVIQINPQDHTRDAVYVLTNVGNESVPASLAFRDVSGNGKTDIVVTIGDSNPYTIVMLNNGKTFQPTQAAH